MLQARGTAPLPEEVPSQPSAPMPAMPAPLEGHWPKPIPSSALRLKRALDVVLGLALLVALSPVLFAAMVLIRVTSRGPVFFVQQRIGYGGSKFPMLKLRTMVANRSNRLRGSQSVLQLSPTFPPYHVFGFTQRSIRFLLEKHGFEILSLRVAAWFRVSSDGSLKGRARAFAAMSIQPIANLTRTAHNMFIFARRPVHPDGTTQSRSGP